MKIPMKWIREYTDVPESAQAYSAGMIMTGTAVEGTENTGDGFSRVVVGLVTRCVPHPDSDHLHVCMVDVGESEPIQIVCGAPNVREGMRVAAALEGAHLPDGNIKKGKLRGVESCGMLCSGPELGVPEWLYPHIGDEGIMEIMEDAAPGTDVKGLFGLGDDVIDFEILANRPDCLSVWGIARESAAVFGKKFNKPVITVLEKGQGCFQDYAKVDVMDSELCPRYCAKVVTNVKIGKSPLWLRSYLHGAGVRSINNIVDITNFVMLETGHPMHAFDLSKVRHQTIIVRRARDGEELVTLDGKNHALTRDMLVIADSDNATGLAGIMGGEESEITEDTGAVLFECAAFDRANIRITTRNLGIRTEASGHFEKGVCADTAMEALLRACQLVNDLGCGDIVPGAFDSYPVPAENRIITASCDRIRRRVGVDIPDEKMEEILNGLSIPTLLSGGCLTCSIPPFRQDMETDADVSEEVLRMYGYDHIPSTLMNAVTMPGFRSETQKRLDFIRAAMKGMGLYEIMNYSFISPKQLANLNLPEDDWRSHPVVVRNPLGEDTSVMRTTLVPSMIATLQLNLSRGIPAGRVFELSNAFRPTEVETDLPEERLLLSIGMFGEDVDFYALKNVITGLAAMYGVAPRVMAGGEEFYHPGRRAVLFAGDKAFASMGELHPDVAEACGIEKRVYIAEIDVMALLSREKGIYGIKEPPKYPAVTRDIAVVAQENVGAGEMQDVIRRAGGKSLEEVKLFDVYRGEKLGEGTKSVAYSLSFRAADRTLTDQEVQKSMDKILSALKKDCGAEIRA